MAYGNRNRIRKPFPVTPPRRPGQLQNPGSRLVGPRRRGPGITPPPSGLRGRGPGMGGVAGRLGNLRNAPNPFRKRGSGGSRRMGTPSPSRVMGGRNRRGY